MGDYAFFPWTSPMVLDAGGNEGGNLIARAMGPLEYAALGVAYVVLRSLTSRWKAIFGLLVLQLIMAAASLNTVLK